MNAYITAVLKKGESHAAFDSKGNMVGLRAGATKDINNWIERRIDTGFLKKVLPTLMWLWNGSRMGVMLDIIEALDYNTWKFMDEKAATKVWEGLCICTSPNIRARGLGTRLVTASMELAKANGCQYMYIFATGNYSNKLFDRLGFSVENEFIYDDYRDENGELILKDVREHTKGKVRLIKL